VVVIDGEGKQARITELTGGTRNRVGLSDLLAGETVGEDARYKDKESEARIIPIGKSRVVALNMSNLSRFEDLLKDLRIEFDAVLIDCPALSRATDARFLSRIVDAVLVVVEWRKTPRVKVGRTIEHLSGRPDLPIMLALNKVQPRLVPQSTLSFRPADRAAA
jgi:Mrp family chromosome partitioning ATPase